MARSTGLILLSLVALIDTIGGVIGHRRFIVVQYCSITGWKLCLRVAGRGLDDERVVVDIDI